MAKQEEFWDLERVYDEQIYPLMRQVIAICNQHDMPFFAQFQYQNDRERGAGLVTSGSVAPPRACPALVRAVRSFELPESSPPPAQAPAPPAQRSLWNKEQEYDREVAPYMQAAFEACKRLGIPMVATVQFANTTDGEACVSVSVTSPPETGERIRILSALIRPTEDDKILSTLAKGGGMVDVNSPKQDGFN